MNKVSTESGQAHPTKALDGWSPTVKPEPAGGKLAVSGAFELHGAAVSPEDRVDEDARDRADQVARVAMSAARTSRLPHTTTAAPIVFLLKLPTLRARLEKLIAKEEPPPVSSAPGKSPKFGWGEVSVHEAHAVHGQGAADDLDLHGVLAS